MTHGTCFITDILIIPGLLQVANVFTIRLQIQLPAFCVASADYVWLS